MERYLGADVHAASVTFCVLDASGRQLRRDVVETNGKQRGARSEAKPSGVE